MNPTHPTHPVDPVDSTHPVDPVDPHDGAGPPGRPDPRRWSVLALVAADVATVSTNGLSYTAVAEYAGTSWAGRALGVHVTTQNALAAATAPAMGAVITGHGYLWAYALTLGFPLAAVALTPRRI